MNDNAIFQSKKFYQFETGILWRNAEMRRDIGPTAQNVEKKCNFCLVALLAEELTENF